MNMNKKTAFIFILLSFFMLSNAFANDKDKVLAEVGDSKITQKTLDSIMQDQQGQMPPEAQKEMLNRLVEIELFYKEALKQKMDKTEKFKERVKIIKKQILAMEYVEELKKNMKISEEQILEFFNKEYAPKKEFKASHILLKKEDKKKAEEILTKIKKDNSLFEKLAKEKSECPSKNKGGDLGWFGQGSMVKEFEDAVLGMKKGEIKGLIETQFGYHIIKLVDTKVNTQRLEDVKESIKGILKKKRT